MLPELHTVDHYDRHLTLDGLRMSTNATRKASIGGQERRDPGDRYRRAGATRPGR